MAGRALALVIEPDHLFRSFLTSVLENLDMHCVLADANRVLDLDLPSVTWVFLDAALAATYLPQLLQYPDLRVALMGWDPELQEAFQPWFPRVVYVPKHLFKDPQSVSRVLDSASST